MRAGCAPRVFVEPRVRPLSGRAPLLLLCSAAFAGLAFAQAARAQALGPDALRSGTPQVQGPGDPVVAPGSRSAIARGQPRRASQSVQAPALRGSIQRGTGLPKTVVSGLNASEPPPVPRRRRPVEDDPWAPLGIRLGSLVLKPAVTASGGYDTNPERKSGFGAKGSFFQRYDAELGLQSDWNVHELKGQLRGGYIDYFTNRQASRPDAQGNLDLRLDIDRDTRLLLESRAQLDTQRPGSPDLTAAVQGRPEVWQYGGAAGITRDINRLQLTLRGAVDRSDYADAQLSSGAILSQKDRNQTQYDLRLRAAYEVTPGIRPFVEAEIDRREFDEKVDSNGYRRSSSGLTGRIGSSFELSRQLTGEISGGYQNRRYEDARLQDLRGFVGDAALIWSPTPLTTVTLRGSASLGDTTVPGSSGTTARRATIEIAHALRRNLTVTGFATLGRTEYDGQSLREDLTSLGARLEYKLTRTFAIRASFTHERLNSTATGADYTANVSQVGLRVQF